MPAMNASPLRKNAAPALARMLDKAKNLERDHRQDARHQIENKTADEAEEEKFPDTSGFFCRSHRVGR